MKKSEADIIFDQVSEAQKKYTQYAGDFLKKPGYTKVGLMKLFEEYIDIYKIWHDMTH